MLCSDSMSRLDLTFQIVVLRTMLLSDCLINIDEKVVMQGGLRDLDRIGSFPAHAPARLLLLVLAKLLVKLVANCGVYS